MASLQSPSAGLVLRSLHSPFFKGSVLPSGLKQGSKPPFAKRLLNEHTFTRNSSKKENQNGFFFSRRTLLPLLAMNAFVCHGSLAESGPSETVESLNPEFPKVVFVAGATGQTGKRIVELLLKKNIKVKAGVRSLEKARATFPSNPNLEFVIADVTEGVDRLAQAISGSEALICATGFTPSLDLTASWKVDNFGTVALVDASKRAGIDRFVLVTSLLTNGAAWGQLLNPSYLILNAFGLVLVAKLQAELYLRKSGLNYTIIRPGGLRNDPPSGYVIASKEDTLFEGSISRDSVAEVAVEALLWKEANNKVVEIVSSPDAPRKTFQELFASIP